jgi:hypothetical protein
LAEIVERSKAIICNGKMNVCIKIMQCKRLFKIKTVIVSCTFYILC